MCFLHDDDDDDDNEEGGKRGHASSIHQRIRQVDVGFRPLRAKQKVSDPSDPSVHPPEEAFAHQNKNATWPYIPSHLKKLPLLNDTRASGRSLNCIQNK